MPKIIIIAHNIRSTHNVGSIIRSAEGLGVEKVYLTGYSPYPKSQNDTRLPHLADKIDKQITKTALGAERHVDWEYVSDVNKLLNQLKSQEYLLVALEQTADAMDLKLFQPPPKIGVLVGSELGGITKTLLSKVDLKLHIPMLGQKDSLNVSVATAIAIFQLNK